MAVTQIVGGGTGSQIKAGTITNTEINSSAAIAYLKLNLTGSILNADINSSAAIVYSKLSLTNSIVNADIASAAAIAYSKLALTNSIVNADIASGAAIALSKLATPVIAANGSQAFTADQSHGGFKITNLADPTSAQDGATKAYVDSVAAGLDPKASVRVATTTAGTYASSFANGQTVDGVTLVTGDRILIKNQASAVQNGIHVVQSSGAPVRASDSDGTPSNEVTLGNYTFVTAGTVNAATGWVLNSSDATDPETSIVPGTDTQTWIQFSASTAVTVSGTTNRITVTGGPSYTVDISASYVGQSSITTLGTITTGVWNGTTIGVANGGTGATTFTSNGILYGNGTSAVQVTAQGASGTLFKGTGGAPAFTSHIFQTDNASNSALYSDATSIFEIRNSTESGGMNVYSSPTTTNSVTSGAVSLFSGGASGTTADTGTVSVFSGNATGTSGDVNLSTGTGATAGKVRILTANTLRAEFDSTGINLSGGEAYKIGGTSVLNASTLGSGVTTSSLTTVGTIGTGVWQGTTIANQYGGTGLNTSTAANGKLLIGNGSGFSLNNLTAGTNITIDNSVAGQITISSTGALSATNFVTNELVSGTIDGSNTAFTLANTPTSGTQRLYLNGIALVPGAGNDYTISGANVTMLYAPQTGSVLEADYMK